MNKIKKNISIREASFLKLIAAGMSIPEIANELSLTIATIKSCRQKLLTKMKMRNNAGLAFYAMTNHYA